MIECSDCGRRHPNLPEGERVCCPCGRWLTASTRTRSLEAHRCSSCGASVDRELTVCTYCRSTLLTLPCPTCYAGNYEDATYCAQCGERLAAQATASTDAQLNCPRCRSERLKPRRQHGQMLHVCGGCAGVFLSHDALDALRKHGGDASAGATPTSAPIYKEQRVQYLACPLCADIMTRRSLQTRPALIVDECTHHGVWFDTGELHRDLTRAVVERAVDPSRPPTHETTAPAPQTTSPLDNTADTDRLTAKDRDAIEAIIAMLEQ